MPKLKKHTLYTSEKVSKIIKNIFKHLRTKMGEGYNEFSNEYYDFLYEKDLYKIEKHWIKKYLDKVEKD